MGLPGYTWQCEMKYTNVKLQTIQNRELIWILEDIIRGGMSSVMRDRYVKSADNRK